MDETQCSRRAFLRTVVGVGGAGLLAACGGAPIEPVSLATQVPDAATPASAAAQAPASGAATLTGQIDYFTYDLGPANDSRKTAITAFQTANPGTTVKLTVLPYEELWQKVAAQMAAGQPPDVIYGDFSLLRNALDGQLLDLSERVAADDVLSKPELFTTDMTDAVQAKYGTDKVHALIMGTWVPILYYNRDIFDAAGVAYPSDDWTWEDVRAAGKQLTKASAGQYGFQFGTTLDNVGWFWWQTKPADFWAQPQIYPEKTAFNSPSGLRVMQLFHSFGKAGDAIAIPPDEAEAYEVYAGGFGAGKVGMFAGGDWDAGWSFRDLPFKWGMTLLPTMTKDYRPSLNTMLSSNVITTATKNPELAWAFVRFLSATPEGQTIIGQGAYESPVLKEAASADAITKPAWAAPGYEARFKAVDLEGPMYTPYPLNLNLWEWPEKTLGPTVRQLKTGETTPEAAVALLDQDGTAYYVQQKQAMQ